MGRTRNNSVQESIGSIQQTNSPREPLTLVIYSKKNLK
jgi:hypothetical protein